MKANAGHEGYEGHQGNESHEGHESHYLYVWLKIVKRRALDHSLLCCCSNLNLFVTL